MKRMLFLLGVTVLVGCQELPKAPERVDVRGVVSNLRTVNDRTSFLVQGKKEPSLASDQAVISLTPTSRILLPDGKMGNSKDVRNGMKVEVTFDGPVMESYPVQANAGSVRILR